MARFFSFAPVALFATLAVACAAPTAPGDDAAEAGEQLSTIDIPKSESLLAKAVAVAERHAQGNVCEDSGNGDVLRSTIVDLLRQAVAVRDTVYFRTKVIAKKAILAQELSGTLEWQEILGTFDPRNLATLPAALATGVSLWDTDGGAYGNKARIEFHPNGQAVLYVLDVDTNTPVWHHSPTTWSFENRSIHLGTGTVYEVKFTDGMLEALEPGTDFPAFVSPESECEA
jgi:hypothetical protein